MRKIKHLKASEEIIFSLRQTILAAYTHINSVKLLQINLAQFLRCPTSILRKFYIKKWL